MNRKQQSVVLAGMLALALAGCSSMRGSSPDEAGSAGASSSGAGSSMGSGGTGSSMGSGSGSGSTSSTMGSGAGTSSMGSGATSATPGSEAAGSMAGTGSTASQQSQSQSTPGAPPAGAMSTPNAVVVAIEAMPRQGTGAVGGSGTGTTGSSMGEDTMYRVTLRMDDGTTKVVTQVAAPTFRMGDRVNMSDGMISR
jgi:hypothetical protein